VFAETVVQTLETFETGMGPIPVNLMDIILFRKNSACLRVGLEVRLKTAIK